MQARQRVEELRERAMTIASTHRKSEAALISVLQEIDADRAYLHFGARSLYDYCERILKLSEGTSYNLITVARRANEVPALRVAVEKGEISVSKARKIAPVLTKENQDAWLELAATKTSREIERAVADVNPRAAEPEKFEFLSSEFARMTLDIPDALMRKLRRAQDVESRQIGKHATMLELLEAMTDSYLERRDPVAKAERAMARKSSAATRAGETGLPCEEELVPGRVEGANLTSFTRTTETPIRTRRTTVPASIRHSVFKRDEGRCTYEERGVRCTESRWIQMHHVHPVSEGGADSVENLVLVCEAHHHLVHNGSFVRAGVLGYVA